VRHIPNIVHLWDFETGDTQGWGLGPYSSLDNTSKVQGTYSIKYTRYLAGSYTDLIASISGIDLTNVSRPLLLLIVKDYSSDVGANYPHRVRVVVKDTSTTYIDSTQYVIYRDYDYTRILAFNLMPVAGKSGLTIELYENSSADTYQTVVHYYDMIALVDGGDYEYDIGLPIFSGQGSAVGIPVPDSSLPATPNNIRKFALILASPPWGGDESKDSGQATATCSRGSLSISSSDRSLKHVNYAEYSSDITSFTGFTLNNLLINSVTADTWAALDERFVVAFLDTSWNYARIYVFNFIGTVNGISPRFLSVVNTTTYGTAVTGYKDVNVKIHAYTNFDVALKVKFVVGTHASVSSGFVKLEVYSSDFSTKYGEVSVDLTAGDDQTTAYITGLPKDTALKFRVSWGITANSRVIALVYPLIKVH